MTKKRDWRTLPRKAPELRRSKNLTIRVTVDELDALRAKANKAGLNVSEFVIRCCLGWRES